MIIGVDGNEANVSKKVGVSVYTFYLLEEFKKKAAKDLQFRIFLKNPPISNLPSETENFKYEVVPGPVAWSQLFLPLRLLLKKNVDVFFTPAHYAPRFCPTPLIVTVHDLAYFYYPQEFLKRDLFKLKRWTQYSVNKATKVIAVSENTKKDLLEFYSLPTDKISVIYNGYKKLSQKKDLRNRFTHPELKSESPYILYVGTLQPRKNIQTLIKSFKDFTRLNKKFKLVVTGKKGWLYDEIFNLANNLELKDSIIFTGHVSDSELEDLYKKAFCFVMPSFYEGFGMPILEAMSNGCPVISSNASSLTEVGGDSALYFDPEKDEDLLANLNMLLENETMRENLIKKGLEHVKSFSWQTCADKTLNVIKSAL